MLRKNQTGQKPKKPSEKKKGLDESEVYKKLYENTGPVGLKPTISMPKVSYQRSISKTTKNKFSVFGRYLKHKFGESPQIETEPVVVPKKRCKSKFFRKNIYDLFYLAPTSDQIDISKSYRRQVIIHHPDKGGDPFAFRCLNKAYEILSNKDLRHIYDNEGLTGLKDLNEIDLTELELFLSENPT